VWGKLIASSALCAGALSCWKMKNSLEIWRMADNNCCNSITLRLVLLANFDFVIDKCQTGVMPIPFYSPTDAIIYSNWTLVVQAGVLSRRLSCWLMDVRTVDHSAGFSVCKYLFVSEQNDAKIIGLISRSNCFEWLSLASLSRGSVRFLCTNVS